MKSIILFVCILSFISSSIINPDWQVNFYNEEGGDDIILIPGRYTKLTVILSKIDEKKSIFDLLSNTITYTFKLTDTKVISFENNFKVSPNKGYVYSIYVGLKCGNIEPGTFTMQFEDDTTLAKLKVNNPKYTIKNEINNIEIEPIIQKLPSKTYGLFKISNELMNVDDITIEFSASKTDIASSKVENIIIPAFKGINQISNNGIINFKYYGTSDYSMDKYHNAEYDMNISNKCYKIISSNGNKLIFEFKDEVAPNVGSIHKDAIVFNLENITPKYGDTNSIEISTIIPIAPAILTCEANKDYTNDIIIDNIINMVNKDIYDKDTDKNGKYFQTFISQVDENKKTIIKFDDLNVMNTYHVVCVLSNTDYYKPERQYFSIGNNPIADYKVTLIPSRDKSKVAQCAQYTFTNIGDIDTFTNRANNLCLTYMNDKSSSLFARIMGCNKCDILNIDKTNKKLSICSAPSPVCPQAYIKNQIYKNVNPDTESFTDKFSKFISLINTKENIKKNLDLNDFDVNNIKMYYDYDTPSKDNIIVNLIDIKDKQLSFSIENKNKQPIQCYYNKNLNKDNKNYKHIQKKFISEQSVIINPDETVTIYGKLNDKNKKNMYSLFMQCYNLPNFKYHYENTGIFNAYTYYGSEDNIPSTKVIIDCNGLNKLLPKCIKSKLRDISTIIKTGIPNIISKIQDDLSQFETLSNEAQIKIINELDNDLDQIINDYKANINDNEKFKLLIQKIMEVSEYLSKRNCIYVKNWDECRNNKKQIMKKIIDIINDTFTKEKLDDTLKKLSNNIDESLKQLLFLFNEITDNSDAYIQGTAEKIIDLNQYIIENFNTYLSNAESYIKSKISTIKSTIKAYKKDYINLLTSSISNLVNSLHYAEIDGYISDKEKQLKDSGIMLYEQAKIIHKNILNSAKKLIEFGEGFYNITNNMQVNVSLNTQYDSTKGTITGDINLDIDGIFNLNIAKYDEQGIIIKFYPEYMMKLVNAYSLEVIVYDSPLVPINQDNKNTLSNTFISITLYDKNGNEIELKDMKDIYRPIILYNTEKFKEFKSCLYLDPSKYDMLSKGINFKNIQDNGKNFIQCISQHLTDFSAGNYEGNGIKWWVVMLIIFGILALLIGIFFVYRFINRNKYKDKITADLRSSNSF